MVPIRKWPIRAGPLSRTGDRLILQGDQRQRLPALLTARGVKKVTVG